MTQPDKRRVYLASIALAASMMLTAVAMLPVAKAQGVVPVPNTIDPQQVISTLTTVADWQLAHTTERDPRHWSIAPLLAGLIDASLATGTPEYLAAVLRVGIRIDFDLGSRTYHADGHGAGYSWLRIYFMDRERDADFLEPFIEQFDEIVENPINEDLSFSEEPPEGLFRTDRWSWADALYMSPPTIALLAEATGKKSYRRYIDAEFRYAFDMLYDTEDNLFYRDDTYIDDRTPNGEKVFWSRGNAWVYAGVSRLLEILPEDYPTRCFYVTLFREMSRSLLAAQQPDGHWYTSLLDPEHVPVGETSGSALFVSAMARGVSLGIIESEVYWPAVERGWSAILTRIDPDGAVNFVQPFGEAPEPFSPESRTTYGTGAVLLAGSQIVRALGATPDVEPAAFLAQAEALVGEVPDLTSICEEPCMDL